MVAQEVENLPVEVGSIVVVASVLVHQVEPVAARHTKRAQQWPTINLKTDHGELPALEAKVGIARCPEREQFVSPVPNVRRARST